MEAKELQIPFSAALHGKDTETQTFGCRATNPDICLNNGLSGVCAFVNEDCICRKPSRAWKKQFAKLVSTIKFNSQNILMLYWRQS